MCQTIKRKNQANHETHLLWRGEDERWTLRNELELLDLELKLGFFFSLPAARDVFAKLTWIRAVERLGDRFSYGRSLKILRKHVRPRHGLEHGPMSARRAQ